MVKYIEVINGLTSLLNKKGRGKKGFKLQDEFKGYIKTLKNDFGQSISTQFLFNLMKDNKSLSNRQKTHKIFNLTRGLNKNKKGYYTRGLNVMNYRTEIKEYKHTKKPFNLPSVELSEDEQTQINEIKAVALNSGVELIGNAENKFKERVRRRNAFYNEGVILKSVKYEQVGKEFITSHRKNFNFINIE